MSNPSGLPDLVFVEREAATIEAGMVTLIESRLGTTLALGDPRRAVVSGVAALLVQERQNINITGRQNLLAFASKASVAGGDPLKAIGTLVLGDYADYLPAAHALTTIRFTLSAPRGSVTTIPSGSRIAAGDVLFATTEADEIAIGDTTCDVTAQAEVAGITGNGFLAGQINALVEPIPFVESAANLTESEGGAPEETEDAYRDRIKLKMGSFSVAGPEAAYQYWAKTASTAISDVSVVLDEENPGTVLVYPLLQDGVIPGSEVRALVLAALSGKTRRPLTDVVQVVAATSETCDVEFTYWIDEEDAAITETIQAAVDAAVIEYRAWQRAKLGRDINPDKLRSLVIAAGAKRMTVVAPAFASLTLAQVAQDGDVDVTYGGIEDA